MWKKLTVNLNYISHYYLCFFQVVPIKQAVKNYPCLYRADVVASKEDNRGSRQSSLRGRPRESIFNSKTQIISSLSAKRPDPILRNSSSSVHGHCSKTKSPSRHHSGSDCRFEQECHKPSSRRNLSSLESSETCDEKAKVTWV